MPQADATIVADLVEKITSTLLAGGESETDRPLENILLTVEVLTPSVVHTNDTEGVSNADLSNSLQNAVDDLTKIAAVGLDPGDPPRKLSSGFQLDLTVLAVDEQMMENKLAKEVLGKVHRAKLTDGMDHPKLEARI